MIAEFTVIGLVVRSTELVMKTKRMFRFNVAINFPGTKDSSRSMYINNITIWNPNAIELAKKVIVPGTMIFVRGHIQNVNVAKKRSLSKDAIYFNAHTFFVLRKSDKDIEESKYKKEMGDFMSVDTDYMLFPGDSEKNDGYYPTSCGDETYYEGRDYVPEEPEE